MSTQLKTGDRIKTLAPLIGGWQGEGIVVAVEDSPDPERVVKFKRHATDPDMAWYWCYIGENDVEKLV